MSVTTEFFPFLPGGGATPVTTGTQHGTATLVPADGSSLAAVAYPVAFATSLTGIEVTINQLTRIGTDELTIQVSGGTLTGFNIYVAGGQPGSTVSVFWRSYGT